MRITPHNPAGQWFSPAARRARRGRPRGACQAVLGGGTPSRRWTGATSSSTSPRSATAAATRRDVSRWTASCRWRRRSHHAGRWRRRLGRRAGERPAVEADPTLPDHSRRLRARRHGRVRDGSVSTFPGFPPVAMQQGRYAARAARARLQGRARRPSGTKTKAIWPPSAAPRQSRTSRAAPSALQGDGSAPLPSSTALGRALIGHKTDSCAQIPGDPDYSRAIRPHRFLGPCRIFARAAPHRRRRESHLRSKRPQVRILPGALSESPA